MTPLNALLVAVAAIALIGGAAWVIACVSDEPLVAPDPLEGGRPGDREEE
jgi:hypothetical protein